ncbi:hypothetical protein niasHT_015092 [Heterodera trifolii]|uniref:DNA2/NAM7 helicase-like C-terminal domain-containing protein n=1 Tax=Heterodera trifolii TaxID=157864 RepID=A0ABD2LBU2_9BILA
MPKKYKKAKKDKVGPALPAAPPPSVEPPAAAIQYEDLTSDEELDSKAAGGTATAHIVDQQMESLLALSPENNGAMLELSPDSVDRLLEEPNAGESVPITAESNEKALGSTVLKESGEFVQTNSGENDKTSLEIVKIVSPLETMGALIGVISQKDDESVEKVPQDSSEKANAGEMEVEGDAKALGSSVLSVEAQIDPNPMANSDQVEIENEEVDKGENEQFSKRNSRDSDEEENFGDGKKMVVCQIREDGVIVIPFGQDERPGFVFVANDFLSEIWETLARSSDTAVKLGDIIWVTNWRVLQLNESWDWISNSKRINAEAEATSIAQVTMSRTDKDIGIISDIRTNPKQGNRLVYVDFAVPGFEAFQRLYPHQLSLREHHQLQIGALVSSTTVQVDRPPDLAIGQFGLFILPAKHDKASDQKIISHRPILGTGIIETLPKFQFPFSATTDIHLAEKGIAAALSFCFLKNKTKMEEFAIETTLHILDNNGRTVVATFEHFLDNKRKFVDLVEFWEEDAAIQARLKGARILLAYQAAKNHDSDGDFEFICEGHEVVLSPCESATAMVNRMTLFYSNSFSLISSEQSGTGQIWRALLSSSDEQSLPAQITEARLMRHPALKRLEGGQKQSAMLMLDDQPRIVAQQAPPGSGKTFTLAAIVAALLERPDAKFLCMAPLNVAVVKICEELVEALRVEGVGVTPLALFSGNGKGKYRDQLDRISDNLLEAAATSEEFWKKLKEKEQKEVRRYQKHARKRPRIAKEAKIAEVVLSIENKRVLCCTLGFAEQIGRLIKDRNMIVLDESGQAPFVQVCSVLSPLQEVQKLFITGDRYQLAVNMKDIPEQLRVGFGFDTVLLNTDSSPGVDKTTLEVNYRSHPEIVNCVEYAAYTPHGERLRSGPGIFRMLTNFAKMPIAESPIVLIHQDSPMEAEETSFLATNSGQTRTVIDLLRSWRGFPGSVRVISLYSGQAAQIGRELRANAVTRNSRRNDFWGDPARVNVSISRGKHGLVVVGNLLELSEATIWNRFLKKALEFTVVTSPEFIQISAQQRSHYVLSSTATSVTSVQARAMANSGSEHQSSQSPGKQQLFRAHQQPSWSEATTANPMLEMRRTWARFESMSECVSRIKNEQTMKFMDKTDGDATFAALTFAPPSQSDTCGADTCGEDICAADRCGATLAAPTDAAPSQKDICGAGLNDPKNISTIYLS